MLFPGNQQKIADAFLIKDIKTINDFIDEFCNLQSEIAGQDFRNYSIHKGDIIQITENPDTDLLLFNDFITAIEILQKESILYFRSNLAHGNVFPFFIRDGYKKNEPVPYKQIIDIIKQYHSKFFVFNKEELKDFIERGYCSLEISELQREREDRKQAQKSTKLISVWAIIVTSLSLIVTTIFNLFSICSDTKVQIKENSAFQDSINVNINNLREIKKSMQDTIIIINKESGSNNKNDTTNQIPKSLKR